MKLPFRCPQCSSSRLEEVMIDVTVSSEITEISDEGSIDYGKQTNEDGEVERYQCMECGFEIPGVTDCQDLAAWLAAHCPPGGRMNPSGPDTKEPRPANARLLSHQRALGMLATVVAGEIEQRGVRVESFHIERSGDAWTIRAVTSRGRRVDRDALEQPIPLEAQKSPALWE